MGLRQSKRSVDITGSPKKETPAAVVEKIPQINDTGATDKNEDDVKNPINGETKATEALELASVILILYLLNYSHAYLI